MKDLMDKLKFMFKKIFDKGDEVDSDIIRMMNELNDKVDELIDVINNVDVDGKSEDIKVKFDDILDEFDKVNEKVNDVKDKLDSFENFVDEIKIIDIVDEFIFYMNNLENVLDRVGK